MKLNQDLLGQLQTSNEMLKGILEDAGGCDHSVGHCVCRLIQTIENNEIVIAESLRTREVL